MSAKPTGLHPKDREFVVALIRAASKVHPQTGCWEWQRGKAKGYGRVMFGGRLVQAHRLAYEAHHGEVASCLVVHHECRNRACVNPDHLVATTYAWNSRFDNARLSVPDIAEIRRRATQGESYVSISRDKGVSDRCISQIVKRVIWKEVA